MINLNLTSATRIGLNVLALLGLAVALYLGQRSVLGLAEVGREGEKDRRAAAAWRRRPSAALGRRQVEAHDDGGVV